MAQSDFKTVQKIKECLGSFIITVDFLDKEKLSEDQEQGHKKNGNSLIMAKDKETLTCTNCGAENDTINEFTECQNCKVEQPGCWQQNNNNDADLSNSNQLDNPAYNAGCKGYH